MSDSLLSEIERQRKYLNELPSDYNFPLFNAKQALESQRRSAYKDTAAASREIIDNAIEAGADRVDVVFSAERAGTRKSIKAIAFIDNGSGMLPQMARYALSWGGGTHFEDHDYIGKFGFGLPNASINQTRRVEVYTRTDPGASINRAVLDINTFNTFGVQAVPPPEESELPDFVRRYLAEQDLDFEHGTVVVWVAPDRLTYRSPSYLKEHMIEDFASTYRYRLRPDDLSNKDGGVDLIIEGLPVRPVDPLFLMPDARFYLAPEDGGASEVENRLLPVKYVEDEETGERHLSLVEDKAELDDVQPRDVIGTIQVRVARFPVGFAEDKGRKKGPTTDAHRRFEIRKPRRGMSFVRANRELQTVDAFPRSTHDIASGLGRWPLLQAYAYHWAVEVRFTPELDEVFGITNDKQGVRPIEDFWRVLSAAEVDQVLRRETTWQVKRRQELRRKHPEPPKPGQITAAEQAAKSADVAAGTRPRVPEHRLEAVRQRLEEQAKNRVGDGAATIEEAKTALEQEARRRPYRIAFVENDHGPFYEPDWEAQQMVVSINKRHLFYEHFYQKLLQLPGAATAKESLDVLLITLSRAELTVDDEEMALWYQAQRKQNWSPFLATGLQSLSNKIESDEDAEEEEAGEAEQPNEGADPAA